MGQIFFIAHDGEQTAVDIESGKSLMQLAMDNGVAGIDADCGGACACGTCHVMVEQAWLGAVGQPADEETRMLAMLPEGSPTSRLSCQIQVTEAMDGMSVNLPEFQM